MEILSRYKNVKLASTPGTYQAIDSAGYAYQFIVKIIRLPTVTNAITAILNSRVVLSQPELFGAITW